MTRKRLIPHLFFTLAAGLFIYPAAAEHPELSGTWQLDVAASRFANMPSYTSGVLTISTSSHKMIDITVATKDTQSERSVETHWKVDDHFHPGVGDVPGEVLAKWEGPVLMGKRVTDAGVEETRFRLGPDRETLTASIQSGPNVTTLIWRRD